MKIDLLLTILFNKHFNWKFGLELEKEKHE